MNAKHILLVNADPHTRHTYRTLLQLNSFAVREAGDGVEALKAVGQHRPDLIVQELDRRDRIDLIRTAKQTRVTRHLLSS